MYNLVEIWCYYKNYFLSKGSDYFYFGGYPENNELDKLDWGILELLTQDSRMNVVDIAGKLKSTAMIIKNRIKRLEKLEIISSYRIDVDWSKIGMTFFKSQLYMRHYDPIFEKQFRSYCETNPNISYYIKQIGNCKHEIELEVDGYEHYNKIIDDIREKFSGYIRNIDTIIIEKEFFKWVPHEMG